MIPNKTNSSRNNKDQIWKKKIEGGGIKYFFIFYRLLKIKEILI